MIRMRAEIARTETLPKALAQMVKLAERIEPIRIRNVTALGAGVGGGAATGNEGKTPVATALGFILGWPRSYPRSRPPVTIRGFRWAVRRKP